MTYTQAKMIANSPDCYTPEQWAKAASVLLGRLHISPEDVADGTILACRVAETNHT